MAERKVSSETWAGLYLGLVMNLAAVAVLNNPVEASAKVWLVTLGAVNELLGVLLVASPEIGRVMPGFVANIRARVAVVARKIQAFFRKPRNIVVKLGVASESNAAMGIPTVIQIPGASTTLEERVEYLMGRDREIRALLHRIEGEVLGLPDQWRAELAGVKTELETLQKELVRNVAEARIRLRLLGLAYVLLGIVLSWLGNIA